MGMDLGKFVALLSGNFAVAVDVDFSLVLALLGDFKVVTEVDVALLAVILGISSDLTF